MTPSRIVDEFPAPEFRGHQRAALEDIKSAFTAGNDVVLIRAPTGSGKSLLARAIMGTARRADEADPHQPTRAYYTTPQVSQLDAVANDPLLDDLAVIRGKQNYTCLLPGETDTPVDRAPCARDQDFTCEIKHRCPYFSDRAIAAERRFAAMTLAYFMRTASTDTFGRRDVAVIDEAHGLPEWAEMYATIRLSGQTVPIWDAIARPSFDEFDEIAAVAEFTDRLKRECDDRLSWLRGKRELTIGETVERDTLSELSRELDWFLTDVQDSESATEWLFEVDNDGAGLTIKPVAPARYLHHTVWDRAEKFALLSATILDKHGFCRGVGLDPTNVALVDVNHSFPVAQRPLFDVTQGKMTYENRAETLPAIARVLVRIMAEHPAEKGLVHAHSYGIQSALLEHLEDMQVTARIRTHDRSNRDAALADWLRADAPEVFIAVTMEEGLDLAGDRARWQVLCKAPYPNTQDARVAHRLAENRWDWYYRTTLKTIIQACGRIVRSRDDFGATYLADTSILEVFDRARSAMPPWFSAQVEAMTTPDLPAFDPSAAAADARGSVSRSDREQGQQRSEQEADGEVPPGHPLSDIWG